ncbi:putative disease resistance protein RGA3 isoform X2 [Arachis hypogaea]|uniref:putative disease resistance protein RGA3 isoform X2 n=1 Tax=Arachis hypogaea TaxID=3818 RepID=UPI0007AF30F1
MTSCYFNPLHATCHLTSTGLSTKFKIPKLHMKKRCQVSSRSSKVTAFYGLRTPPYEHDAVKPYMSKKTIDMHWGEHHHTFIECLNKQLEKDDILYGYTLDELVKVTYNNGNPLPEFKNAAENFVQNELATIWGVESHTVKLSSNLSLIHAVLQDVEKKQITERAVKLWLQKLLDAAYVFDDILDECSIKSNRLVLKAHVMYFARFHPRIILFHRDIGRRMKEITKRFHEIDEERRKFELHAGVAERQQEDDQWRQTCSVRTEQHMYGRDQDRDEILKFLLSHSGNTDELSVYPIVGIGGLGKTTLAQWIFNDDCVIKHFDLRIWVCISSDFNIMKILQSIVEFITLQNPNLSTLESMQKKVQEMLLRKRYLLVLDNVWNEDQEEWKKLKCMLQCGSGVKGSVILVTTRNESVASIMGTCSIHRLLPLSENDNWSLFKHHAFGNNKESAELEKIGKEIVKKCVGFPSCIQSTWKPSTQHK